MDTLKSKIEVAVLGDYNSIYQFCRAFDDRTDGGTEDRTAGLLGGAIREWASAVQSARKEYESIQRACTNNIACLDNTQAIYWEVDADRVAGYNAKATAQIEVIKTLAYIIGLETDTVNAILTTATRIAQGLSLVL